MADSVYIAASTCTCTHTLDQHTAYAIGVGVTDIGMGACTSCDCPLFNYAGTGGHECDRCGVVTPPTVGGPPPEMRWHNLSCWRDTPWVCTDCGQLDSCRAGGPTCACWINLADVPLADVKAMFADINLNITTDGWLS